MSTNAQPIHVRTEARVLIFLEVTAVTANLDILDPTVRQVNWMLVFSVSVRVSMMGYLTNSICIFLQRSQGTGREAYEETQK